MPQQDKVYRYTGAASRLSGSQNAASSFSLTSSEHQPQGHRDRRHVISGSWTTRSTDKVFKYTLSGSLARELDHRPGGTSPTGITIDPTNVSNIWIVDSGTDLVYQYDNAASRTSGTQIALDELRPGRRQHQPARHRRPAVPPRHTPRTATPAGPLTPRPTWPSATDGTLQHHTIEVGGSNPLAESEPSCVVRTSVPRSHEAGLI